MEWLEYYLYESMAVVGDEPQLQLIIVYFGFWIKLSIWRPNM